MLRKHKRKNSKGEEAGFTMIELIIVITLTSILGTFVFNIVGQSLLAQRDMQVRKEHSDDAVLALDKMSRELRQAVSPIHKSGANELGIEKIVSTGNLYVLYKRDTVNKVVLRYQTPSTGSLPAQRDADYTTALGTTGRVVATDVFAFSTTLGGSITLQFTGEDDARTTSVHVRN